MAIVDDLISKSIESMTLAIELYNKPLIKYRTESVVILIINSWENMLKALIKKKKWAKIYDSKKNESKPFNECLDCVKSNIGKSYSSDWYQSTLLLYKERCKVLHYHKGLELLDYMIIQSNIILFRDFIQKYFSKSMINGKNWYILPLAAELPYTNFDFIKNTSALAKTAPEIKNYFKKVVDIHSEQIKSDKNKGILVNVKVSLENITRIKNADLIVGVDNSMFDQKISLEEGIKLSDKGRAVRIKEVSEVLEKYRWGYDDIRRAAQKVEGYSYEKFRQFIREIQNKKEGAFNWGTFSGMFPMKVYNKYTYDDGVIDRYKNFLKKE